MDNNRCSHYFVSGWCTSCSISYADSACLDKYYIVGKPDHLGHTEQLEVDLNNAELFAADRIIEALKQPVLVSDPTDPVEVEAALLAAWQDRVPYFSLTVGESPDLVTANIEVEWVTVGESSTASRTGIAKKTENEGNDPWELYMLAFQRASRLWGMAVKRRTPEDESLQKLLDS